MGIIHQKIMSYNYYMRPNDRGGGGGGRASHHYRPEERESSRGRSRDRSKDFYNGPRNQYYDQRDIYSNETRRRNDRDEYHHRSNSSYNYNYEHHARQHSQSWDPHSSRYPPSSRDDHYRRQERNYSSYHRKRSRSPDTNNNRYSYQDEGFHRSRRQKTISGGESYGRRPLGSTNGAEMRRAAPPPHPMTSNAPQRNGNAVTLPHHGRNGVNIMSSHQNYYRPPQYHHYHHPMNASHGSHDSSSQQDSLFRPPHGQVRMQAPQFNKINNVPELIQTAYSSLSVMSPSDTAAFWNSLAKQLGWKNQLDMSYEQMGYHINQLFEHTRRALETFGMKDLTQTILSMAKLADLLCRRSSNSHHRKDDIASLLTDLLLNNDGRFREDLFLSLASASLRKLDEFDAQGLSNLAYAYALIRFVPVLADGRDLFDHIAIHTIGRTTEMSPQAVANIVWSYATVKKQHDALFKAIGDQVVAHEHLRDFKPQTLSNIVWAYATAQVSHLRLFERMADHIAGFDHLRDFKPQELSNTAWAYATAEVSHPELFEKVGNHIVEVVHLGDFKPQELSNTVWAYATAGVNRPQLFEKMVHHILGLDHLRDFKPQALSNIVWAYATAGVNHPRLFEKIADHIAGLDELKLLRDFETQHISNIVWAYATAQVSQPKLFQQLANAATQCKEHLTSREVANLLWSYASMGIFNKQLFSSFIPTAAKLIDSYNNQGLANVAWAYAVANVDAPTLFHDRFTDRCLDNLGFSIENLSQLHQWHLWQTKEKSRTGLHEALQDICYTTFISQNVLPSKLQEDVVGQLSSIGLDPKEEVLMDSGYRIDALVEVNGKKIGVEVDGPSHFIGKGEYPTGSTILKRRQVTSIDEIELVSVPYWEWNKLGKDQAKKQQYLREILEL
jgi:hypothetical protein